MQRVAKVAPDVDGLRRVSELQFGRILVKEITKPILLGLHR